MAIDRRRFLIGGLGGLLVGCASVQAGAAPRLLSCRQDDAGRYLLSLLDDDGRVLSDLVLPGRGHGMAVDVRQRLAAVFARRPGEFVWIVDLATQQVCHRIAAADGRHFYGHGVFTPDGRWLLCSENAFESGAGVIGIYAATDDFVRVGEFASQGIGPHQIQLLQDGHTLVVANGGIRTHPDLPRVKSNLATMQPNLAYLDSRDGHLLQRHAPPAQWHQLSIRHIAVATDDRVAIALQFEGRFDLSPPLIALQHHGEPLRWLRAPDAIQAGMRNYCGSIAFSRDGTRFAVSSPRGGLVSVWSHDGTYLGVHRQGDACGVCADPHAPAGFLVSDGGGGLCRIDAGLDASDVRPVVRTHWDNHLLAI